LRASGEERHPLEKVDLLLRDPVLSDVITSAQFELLGNTRGSVPPPPTPVYRQGVDPMPEPGDLITAFSPRPGRLLPDGAFPEKAPVGPLL
jgi:hypothetical protein